MKGYEQYKSVVFGCDHAGFELKEEIKDYFQERGFKVIDLNPEYENPILYVKSAHKVCQKVLKGNNILGILVCGTGIGISIAANRFKNIRAALLYDDFTAEYSRKHNNANILVFGGRTMKIEDVKRRIEIFLSNEFAGGKYAKRNDLMDIAGSLIDDLEFDQGND